MRATGFCFCFIYPRIILAASVYEIENGCLRIHCATGTIKRINILKLTKQSSNEQIEFKEMQANLFILIYHESHWLWALFLLAFSSHVGQAKKFIWLLYLSIAFVQIPYKCHEDTALYCLIYSIKTNSDAII